MSIFLPPDPSRVAEWISAFETLEASGRLPQSSPESRRRRAIQTIRAEDRIKRLRSDARVAAWIAVSSPVSDDERARLREIEEEPLTPRRPGDPIRVTSLDR